MRKVAVFGNAGGGKSTLARHLAAVTGLPLYVLDLLQFPEGYQLDRKDGGRITAAEYLKLHSEIVQQDTWILDGYGSLETIWERLEAADTLVYLDLPLATHCWGVTKRLIKGLRKTPQAWPDNSPVLRSSLESYRVVWQCHSRLTPLYRQFVAKASSQRVYHLRSYREVSRFLQAVEHGHAQRSC